MNTLLLIILTLLFGVLVVLLRTFNRLLKSSELQVEELRQLRLTSRARVGNFAVQSGAVTNEQKLKRLGRASAAHRVVFGGEDDSTLNQDLARQARVGRRQGGEDDG